MQTPAEPTTVAIASPSNARSEVMMTNHDLFAPIDGNVIDFLDILENPSLLIKWKKARSLQYHPDKYGSREEATRITQKINHYFNLIQDKNVFSKEPPVLSFSYTHYAEESGDSKREKSKEVHYQVTLPLLGHTFRHFIKEHYSLTDEEVNKLDEAYANLFIQLARELVEVSHRSLIDVFYNSSETLKKEIEVLTNDENQNSMIHRQFTALQDATIGFDQFLKRILLRQVAFVRLRDPLFANDEFLSKLPYVYAKLASNIKHPPPHFLKGFAKILRDIIRAVPTSVVWLLSILGIYAMVAHPLIMILSWMVPGVMSMFTTFNIIMSAILMMEWTLILTGNMVNIITFVEQKILSPLSDSIDSFINWLFSVKLNVLEISNLIPSTKTGNSKKFSEATEMRFLEFKDESATRRPSRSNFFPEGNGLSSNPEMSASLGSSFCPSPFNSSDSPA